MRRHMIVDHAQQLVDQESLAVDAGISGRGAFRQPSRNLGSSVVQRLLEQGDDIAAGAFGTFFTDQLLQPRGQRATVHYRALVR